MAKLDVLSLTGLTLGLIAIVGGVVAKGSSLDALWNPAAFLIVVIGTLGAALVQARTLIFLHAWKILAWAFHPPVFNPSEMITRIVEWSHLSRRLGLLSLENVADNESDPFVRKGLQLLVDGTDPQALRQILESDLDNREAFDLQGARIFESMGVYSPTLGILGAVMGLMAVMQNLADPSKLGHGIAAAFVATIYGVGMANLFFLPIANKLKAIIQARTNYQIMLLEGLISIAEGENPRNIENKLGGFIQSSIKKNKK